MVYFSTSLTLEKSHGVFSSPRRTNKFAKKYQSYKKGFFRSLLINQLYQSGFILVKLSCLTRQFELNYWVILILIIIALMLKLLCNCCAIMLKFRMRNTSETNHGTMENALKGIKLCSSRRAESPRRGRACEQQWCKKKVLTARPFSPSSLTGFTRRTSRRVKGEFSTQSDSAICHSYFPFKVFQSIRIPLLFTFAGSGADRYPSDVNFATVNRVFRPKSLKEGN